MSFARLRANGRMARDRHRRAAVARVQTWPSGHPGPDLTGEYSGATPQITASGIIPTARRPVPTAKDVAETSAARPPSDHRPDARRSRTAAGRP